VHLKVIGGGKTYSELSAESLTRPKNAALAAQVQAVFRGTTLRGLLLNAYAFWEDRPDPADRRDHRFCGRRRDADPGRPRLHPPAPHPRGG
jgi:hypothetical protein